jgi:apolipoprotein D and lipocalin family protein
MERGANMKRISIAAFALMAVSTNACSEVRSQPFQKVVDQVDIERFLGSWYVIALLPSVFEKNAVNGVETYSLDERGNIRVEYVFYEGSPEGKRRVMHQKGWIVDKARNSVWQIQPIWPLRLPYLIIELADDYRYTVIGTNNYKNVWIMARNPALSREDYEGILSRLAQRGYKVDDIKIMTQAR